MFDNAKFIKSVKNVSDLPKEDYPEIVLCGRSNVGKSSFINTIFNKKDLAKTSSTPGKTRSLNYYIIDNKIFMVDLPGFGYAKISKSERLNWQILVEKYLNTKRNFKVIIHLVDCRHKPTDLDVLLQEFISSLGYFGIIILSKIDKLNQKELSISLKRINEFFPNYKIGLNLFPFSAISKKGKKEILSFLTNFEL